MSQSSPKNSALIFIKPQSSTPSTITYLRTTLEKNSLQIKSSGTITGTEIDSKKSIDQHYYAIASKATILSPSQLPVPSEKFSKFFNESWSTVLSSSRAYNALQACKFLNITSS
ncbi:hypothetical protein TrLO_g10683 [Triparma laevis f. longispina]|uniref:Uncharacterized protein n=1 Tax=Triparma laevis f. longispina TaxID=1714387 RepID=A0A9W7FF97_9STRA|nr:hypothetical protein TrLO_g10683 [Triparma laevis f. longispina]